MSEPQLPTGAVVPTGLGSRPESVDPRADTGTVADGLEHSLDPKSVAASRVVGSITIAIVLFVALVVIALLLLIGRPGSIIASGLLGVWLAAAAGLGSFVYFWPAARYRRTSYRLDSNGMRIRRGVIWRAEMIVPRSRLQHLDVYHGPIDRSFGLATLVMHTAGTENASVSLGGLPRDRAYRIRDELIDVGTGDAV